MSDAEQVDEGRRHFLLVTTGVVGAAGAVATAVPFLASWLPSARAQALGGPVEVDIGKLQMGELAKYEWRGQAIYVVRRSQEMLDKLTTHDSILRDPQSQESDQPDYAKNVQRSRKPEYLVLIGVCTHLGCAPMAKFAAVPDAQVGSDWPGGFYCPCHGSKFDLAGRVLKDVPAPLNLRVPPYYFSSDTTLVIGLDKGVA